MTERVLGVPLQQRAIDFVQGTIPRHYSEVWHDNLDHGIPAKENYINGKHVSTVGLAWPIKEARTVIDPLYMPSFAHGEVVMIGAGDYKAVYADEGGKSSRVFKRYGGFSDEYGGKERAEFVAEKLQKIFQTADEVAPGFYLPREVVVDKSKQGEFEVWEIQQRAEYVPISFLNPKLAFKLERVANNVAVYGTRALKEKLIKEGVSIKSTYSGRREISDYVGFSEFWWDAITGHLVALDLVDDVDSSTYARSGASF